MVFISNLVIAFLLAIAVTSCAPKPTEEVLVDSFFSARAFLDANDNRKIDQDDTPVANAMFYVEIQGVKAFGDATDETGNAFIIIPDDVEYPVDVIMEPPKDSALKLITPSKVSVSASTGTVQFLFSK